MILTVPDDDAHDGFERIDATHRWAGLARLPAALVGATAAMIGDWDLQSTLLRRAVQSGARLVPAASGEGAGPFLADGEAMAGFERRLLLASRGRAQRLGQPLHPADRRGSRDRAADGNAAAARMAGARRAGADARRGAGVHARLAVAGRSSHWSLATPLDLVARRIALLRLRPLSPSLPAKRLLWPAAGLALVALGWFEARHGGGWGAMVAALAAAAFAEAMRIERRASEPPTRSIFFSRRAAIWLAIPFAIGGLVEPLSRAASRSTPRRASSSPSTIHHRVARD